MKRTGIQLLCLYWACLLAPAYAQDSPPGSKELNIPHPPSYYDSIVANWRSTNMTESFESFADDYIALDTTTYFPALTPYTDTEYKKRLDAIASPIHLPYNNIVRKHIVAYTTTHKSLTRRMLGQSQYYFPLIERELEKAGLPLELKFLPVIESSLLPTAVSPAGAVGLWQFTLNTGRHYGLEISSMIDARRDPVASTKAACAYLKDLYKIYGDWTLVIASYNYGPGNVNKALQRAGSNAKTYWDIYPYLPKATRDYIPAFVALNYAYNFYKDHHIKPYAPSVPLATDTVVINRKLHLDQVASALNIPLDLLRMLNPQFKQDIVPATVKTYPLVLPQQEICKFLANEDTIFTEESLPIAENGKPSDVSSEGTGDFPEAQNYKIKKGDTLGSIAKKYGVSVKQLMQWNKIQSANKLRIGQVLTINK